MLVVGIARVAVWMIITSYGSTFETIEDMLAAGSAACWRSWARADVSEASSSSPKMVAAAMA
jgi:hypothetical protein